jgi:hypothetical protein
MRTNPKHDRAYVARKRDGIQTVPQSWHWLTGARLRELAQAAYHSATYSNRLDVFEGEEFTDQQLREFFAEALIEEFTTYVTAEAHKVAGCWPTGWAAQGAVERVGRLASEIPQDWRPQYPAYKKLAPAERSRAPGAVTSADEGSANGRDSTH